MVVVLVLVIAALLWLLVRRRPPAQSEPELTPFDRLLLRFYVDSPPTSARRIWSESSLDQQMGTLQRMIEWGWIGPACGPVSLVSESEMAILDTLGNATTHELNQCLDEKSQRLPHRVAQAELARREVVRVTADKPRG
jgi:hypothetical protein